MTTLLVTPKNNKELEFIEKLLKELRIANRAITDEEKEDMGLSMLMKQANRNKKVSRESIMKKLK